MLEINSGLYNNSITIPDSYYEEMYLIMNSLS